MNDYTNYTKCGEILKSPNLNEKDQYEFILKCCLCENEHYIVWDSFEEFPCTKNHREDKENVISGCDIQIQRCSVMETEKDAYEKDPLNLIKDYNTNSVTDVKEEYFEEDSKDCSEDGSDFFEGFADLEGLDKSTECNSEFMDLIEESMDEGPSNDFVHNFIKSKEKVTLLIEAYKKQTSLWNRKSTEFSITSHTKYLGKIKAELKEKLNLQISCEQIDAVIQYLYLKYRQFIESNENAKDVLQLHNKSVWFLKQLEFLRPFVGNNTNTDINPLQAELTSDQIIQILSIYKRFPDLWNTDLVENCCRNKRDEALGRMLETINSEMNLDINEDCLKKFLHFTHTRFTKEKRRKIRNNDTKTTTSYEYFKHMMFLYDHVGPFKCSECDIELRNPLYFKVHKSQHDGSVPLKCSLCSKEFKILRTYTLHARRHMDDLVEECKECGKKFINTCELNIHMRFHTGAKPYCCEICGVSFRHIQTFTSHKRRHEKQYLHNCPMCSKGFYSKAKMDDHIRSHKQIREFACKTCGKAFITKKTLQQHQVTHEDIRRHACTLCGKAFKLKVGVTQHMKTHGSQTYERHDDLA